MSSPRIALVRARYTPFGGAERFVANALEALGKSGAAITLVTRTWPQSDRGAHLICDPFYLGNVWRDWGFARAACKLLEREQFDLVQSHERIACCDIYRAGDGVHREWLTQRTRHWSALKRAKIALNPYHAYVRYAETKLFRSAKLKAVICNSHMVKKEIEHWFQTPAGKLHVIYSGVDTDRFHPDLRKKHRHTFRAANLIPQEAPVYLFIGSGFERKGVATLISAFARLPNSAHLVIVGKDRRQAHFARMAQAQGVALRAHFVGAVTDVGPCYGAADVFVLPTLYDPFPNVILEALASGLPAITSTKSGGAELIRDGINGYVCPADDVAALAHHMRSMMSADTQRSHGIAARQTAENFTLEAMSAQLTSLYSSLLDKHFQ